MNYEKELLIFLEIILFISEAKYKIKYGEGLKILTPKQMLKRLPIVLAQIKAGDNSENLLNEIRLIVHSLYQSKKYTIT